MAGTRLARIGLTLLWALCFPAILLVPVATAGGWDTLGKGLGLMAGSALGLLYGFTWLPAAWMHCLSQNYLLNFALMAALGGLAALCRYLLRRKTT